MSNDRTERLIALRRDLHRHPELGFREHETTQQLRDALERLGIDYDDSLNETGLVATLRGSGGDSDASVALRADIDALPILEKSGADHASTHEGRMHACGHDGHTAMLLGAAEALAERADFDGTVHFVFQPAEETGSGADAMIEAGLFERHSIGEIFALHNWPALPVGRFGVMPGPIMAGGDRVRIKIEGHGGHGGMNPHGCTDPVLIAAELIVQANTIVGREIDPLVPAVLSLCAIEAGDVVDGFNVIPDTARLCGTIRTLDDDARERVREALAARCRGLEASRDCTITLEIEDLFDVTVNDPRATEIAVEAIEAEFGADALASGHRPCMAGEDFAAMLARCPGAYIHVGAGDEEHSVDLHDPHYDFNDAIIPDGVTLLVALARHSLRRQNA